jgi:hypothetical protein
MQHNEGLIARQDEFVGVGTPSSSRIGERS